MGQEQREKGKLLFPGVLGQAAKPLASTFKAQGYTVVDLGPVTEEDITSGLGHVDNDVCAVTIAIVGQLVRYLKENGTPGTSALAPELCKDCRACSTPLVLSAALTRAGIKDIPIVEVDATTFHEACVVGSSGETLPTQLNSPIGITGNVPMLTTAHFTNTVTQHLKAMGCTIITPPLERIAGERDFLTPAVEYFHEQGIRTVICMLPFGCLGGHAYGRGQLRRLRKLYPDVDLTILDYDPSASDINLVNRIELVVQEARENSQ